MKLSNAINRLTSAGIKVIPVPGTSKFSVTLPDGEVGVINEKKLISLASKTDNPSSLLKIIEQAV
ncbi:MAG: hypothetical protein H0Z40_03010 [Desulfotomaculum sp.]|nr:hypothetical protein [Desulfotomaculum sp.]